MNGSTERKQRILGINTLLGKRLATIRHAKGIKQSDVADALAVQRPVISKIEHGVHNLNAAELPDYARGLGMSTNELANIIDEVSLEYDGLSPKERMQL